MNYYGEIKDRLIKNEISKKVREFKNNQSDLTTYYEVGKLLSEAGSHYGEGIIKQYAIKLEKDIGKKYNEMTLRKYRQFYIIFNNQKRPQVAANLKIARVAHLLTWSHYQELLPIKEKNNTYLDIGKLLKNVETKYGKSVIKEYSNRLSVKFNKKYTTSLLYKIKQFYNIVEKSRHCRES